MAAFLDNCRFNVSTSGTADWVYASAYLGSQSPALSGAVNGRAYKWLAISADQTQWEMAEGVYNSGTGTFPRTTVLYNSLGTGTAPGQSGAGAKVSFSASPTVAIIGVKEDLISIEEANLFSSTQKAQARANIDALKKNYIVNGGLQVSQENGTTAGAISATPYYPADQFSGAGSNAGTATLAQVASLSPGGSPNRMRFTVTAADATVGAGDYAYIQQIIEGNRVADLRFGSATPKTITVQFGVKAPAGTYCVVLMNGAQNRAYVAEYTISAGEANTDTIKTVTISGDTTGTWATDTSGGVIVRWGLMAGSTFQLAAGSWAAGAFSGSSNQFNVMGTNGNVFELFDVGLYEGNAAPAFQLPDFVTELFVCKRYWEKSYEYATSPGAGTGAGAFDFRVAGFPASATYSGGYSIAYTVAKRATPTVTIYAYSSGTPGKVRDAINNTDVNSNLTASEIGFRWWGQLSTGSTQMEFLGQYVANARM